VDTKRASSGVSGENRLSVRLFVFSDVSVDGRFVLPAAAVNGKGLFRPISQRVCRLFGSGVPPTLVIVDGAGSHQSNVLSADSCLRLEKLPPNSPELNPAERFFQELRKHLANQVFETREEIEEQITQVLQRYWKEPQLIRSLTSFHYITASIPS